MDLRKGRAGPALLLFSLVLIACSPSGDEGTGDRKRDIPSRSSKTSAGEARSSSPSLGEGTPDLTTTRFQMPSGNIRCESFSSSLLCVIYSGLVPDPSHHSCPVDWIGVFIEVGEYASPSCSGDPGISMDPATELQYEQTWELEGVACLSEETGLTCRDESGNGFTLARAGWSLLGKEDAAAAAFNELRSMVRAQARSDLPGEVASVDAPTLRGGDDCGELQEAFVTMQLTDGRPAIYTACYVSGTWDITAGPLFPD